MAPLHVLMDLCSVFSMFASMMRVSLIRLLACFLLSSFMSMSPVLRIMHESCFCLVIFVIIKYFSPYMLFSSDLLLLNSSF